MATSERTTTNILDPKGEISAALKQAEKQVDLTLTELGINFNRTIVEIELERLKQAPYRSRIAIENRIKSLYDSLKQYGFLGAIFVSSKNNHIIDGWYRKEMWASMGNTNIPCFEIDCTEEQEKLLHLKLNIQVGTFDLADFGLTFPGLNLVEDYGFTKADLHTINQPASRSEKPAKAIIDSSLMRFNTVLQAEQYQRLKTFKEQHALENWADVIDMLLEQYEAH